MSARSARGSCVSDDRTTPIRAPRTVAVDLTPLLPGGENGGAKIVVLELLRVLPRLAPQCHFVLLTQSTSHDELSSLDCANTERLQVLDVAPRTVAAGGGLRRAAVWLLPRLPARVRRIVSGVGYRWQRRGKLSAGESPLRRIGADLLFCPFTVPTFAEPGVPIVSTIHDLQYRTYPQFFSADDLAHRDAMFRAACREATCLAAVSDYTRRSAITHGRLLPSRIRTIHSRLAGRFDGSAPADDTILARLRLERGRYLLYPANFWRHKNHEMLLTAFGMAARQGLAEDVTLVCTGSPGARRDFLEDAAYGMGLGDRVRFPGFVGTAHFAALLQASGGMVFPSLYEGFGLPILEAMATGIPVACSNTTALPEVAGDAAMFFDPRRPSSIAGATVRLHTDESCRERLVAAGRARAREFGDVARMAREYWDLFLQASADTRRSTSLAGVYADGWMGPELRFDVVAPESGAVLDLEVSAPDWMPHARVRVDVVPEGGGRRQHLRVRRGEQARWSVPVRDGRVLVRMGPGSVPAHCGHGDDQRLLTLMLRRCAVRTAGGETTALWGPEAE